MIILLSIYFLGAVVSSGIVLYSYFWFVYVCHLALRILFPMKSTKLYNSDYSRTIYIAEVLCVVSIATVPSIIGAVLSKYRISTFPPTQCENDGALYFYVTIVPVMIVVCFGVIMMLLTLYKIHTVSWWCDWNLLKLSIIELAIYRYIASIWK